MNIVKIILIAIGLLGAAFLVFSIFGIIYSALWYLLLVGAIAVAGAVGYKLLKKDEPPSQLEDKQTVSITEMDNANRTLEEYKRKYLPK